MHIETFLIKYCTTVIMLNFLKIVILMEYSSFIWIFFFNKTIVLYHISCDCFPASFKALIKISAEKKGGHHAIFLKVQKKQAAGSRRQPNCQISEFFQMFLPLGFAMVPTVYKFQHCSSKKFLRRSEYLGKFTKKNLLIIEVIFCNATTHENIFFSNSKEKVYVIYSLLLFHFK